MTPEERAASICSVRIKPHDPNEWGVVCTCPRTASAIRAAIAERDAEWRALFAAGPSAGQPSGDAKGSAQALADVVIDFLSSHGGSECAGRGECVCDDAWPAVGLAWGDLEGARRRNSKRGAQP